MRFEISTVRDGKIEMIGDPVDLPNNCGETFVVHYNPFVKSDESYADEDGEVVWLTDPVEAERFRVTHAGTGFRVGGGQTIDEAIGHAAAKMKDAGEDGVRAVVERATKKLALADVQ